MGSWVAVSAGRQVSERAGLGILFYRFLTVFDERGPWPGVKSTTGTLDAISQAIASKRATCAASILSLADSQLS